LLDVVIAELSKDLWFDLHEHYEGEINFFAYLLSWNKLALEIGWWSKDSKESVPRMEKKWDYCTNFGNGVDDGLAIALCKNTRK
jgi:hypothetical protein